LTVASRRWSTGNVNNYSRAPGRRTQAESARTQEHLKAVILALVDAHR
jgi:hypothetical protein